MGASLTCPYISPDRDSQIPLTTLGFASGSSRAPPVESPHMALGFTVGFRVIVGFCHMG